MGSSYFITYGGNRLTFPGTPGPVAWENPDPMVVVDPLSNGYITMEFTTPGGDTITLDSQMSSASARVPVGSTASWTAHAYSGEALPTASAKTATKTASGSYSTTTFGDEAFAIMSNTVAQRSSLCANCVGYYTASGRVP